MRPLRVATVTHALLKAVCGQLIQARAARLLEAKLIRVASEEHEGLRLPPTRATFASFAPAELARIGLVSRKATALVRLSRRLRPGARCTGSQLLKRVPESSASVASWPLVGRRHLSVRPRTLRAWPRWRPGSDQAVRGAQRPPGPTRRTPGSSWCRTASGPGWRACTSWWAAVRGWTFPPPLHVGGP